MPSTLSLLGLMVLAAGASDLPADGSRATDTRISWPATPAAESPATAPFDRPTDNAPSTSAPRDLGTVPAAYEEKAPEPERRPADHPPATLQENPSSAPAKLLPPAAPITQPLLKTPLGQNHREAASPLELGSHSSRNSKDKPTGGISHLVTMGSSLAIVLGLFFLVAWTMRRASPRGSGVLPGEVFEILGRAPLSGRQQVHLLRCGTKLLLVSVTPAGAETLTEVTDSDEVDRLAGLCRREPPRRAFQQIFQQFTPRGSEQSAVVETEPADRGSKSRRSRGARWEDDNV